MCLLMLMASPFIIKAVNTDKGLIQAETWMKRQPDRFLENKGQMTVFAIYIPNAFTTDGDELNDSFAPKELNLLIFKWRYLTAGEK